MDERLTAGPAFFPGYRRSHTSLSAGHSAHRGRKSAFAGPAQTHWVSVRELGEDKNNQSLRLVAVLHSSSPETWLTVNSAGNKENCTWCTCLRI